MWAFARRNLGLTTEEFFELTPLQFSLLAEAERQCLAHQEMIQAYTTTAVINYSMGAPENPVLPTSFMPNYRLSQTDKEQSKAVRRYSDDEIIDWQTRVATLAAEMRQGHGPMLDEIRSQSNG